MRPIADLPLFPWSSDGGGKNSDRFVLGDPWRVYYLGGGSSRYGTVADFSAAEEDVIQLKGSLNNYTLSFVDGNTTISFNQGSDLIATVNSVDLTSQANVFAFV